MNSSKKYRSAFIVVTLLFFLWGFITVLVDSLIPRLKDVFELSYFQAGLVQFAFFAAYFVFSLPAGFLLSRIGYQKGVVLGLFTMALGCLLFYPAASERIFGVFLAGYFTLAAGITILQVAANPYVAVLGSEDGASSRLNLSQAFNSLGTAVAPLVGASFLLSDTIMTSEAIDNLSAAAQLDYYINEAAAVQSPFLVLAGCIGILALVFIFIKLPKVLEKSPKDGYIKLLMKPTVRMGVVGIFLYVGAEVAIGSYLVNYFMDMNLASIIVENETMNLLATRILNKDLASVDGKAIVGAFVFLYWSGAMVGRFVGAYLTRVMRPGFVLALFASCAIALLLISMNSFGLVAMWSILAVGLFNSIMFPTIFTLTIEGLGDLKPQASGLLCMAIVGGAIVPPLYGLLTDEMGFKFALVLLIACYTYILYFGYKKQRIKLLQHT
ncbi:MAG TPA: sugar MFS transporter [Flavobacteriaceae bacterium]|nr:glucose/galactose MFS transporter [Flavobacteriaceae bacterium]HBR53899.1 glucose/galactose MFS transporter [Flavobacteriaceae bacterium]HIB47664.1 sugar MFS transporter [Flavobacteriaceae bacterium]HIN99450.1 sugar MFS transporter [Flavobacteriaceae bacterium]